MKRKEMSNCCPKDSNKNYQGKMCGKKYWNPLYILLCMRRDNHKGLHHNHIDGRCIEKWSHKK